jgi:hypothetical protein
MIFSQMPAVPKLKASQKKPPFWGSFIGSCMAFTVFLDLSLFAHREAAEALGLAMAGFEVFVAATADEDDILAGIFNPVPVLMEGLARAGMALMRRGRGRLGDRRHGFDRILSAFGLNLALHISIYAPRAIPDSKSEQ